MVEAEIKQRFSLEDAVNMVGIEKLKRSGNKIIGLCPLSDHPEKTLSWVGRLDKQTWRCYGCHKYGDAIDLVSLTYGRWRIYGQVNRCRKGNPCEEEAHALNRDGTMEVPLKNELVKYFHNTDMGNSERFTAQFKGITRYCPQFKNWFIWDGRRWKEDAAGAIYHLAKHF